MARCRALVPIMSALVIFAGPSRAVDVFESEKRLSPEPSTYMGFGYSVSMSGDVLVVGAPFRPAQVGPGGYPIDGGPGAVFVFRHQAGGWALEQKLEASDGNPTKANDFGHSVSTDGNTIVIGAPARTSQTGGHGSAYVFRHEAGAWVEQAILEASDEAPGPVNRFGTAVSLSPDGTVAVIGAPTTGSVGAEPGAYVYRFDGADWLEETKLTASDGVYYDDFGGAVANDGDTVAVGADDRNDVATDAGAAYVFRRTAGVWAEEAKLLASDAGEGRRFGRSVSLAGDLLLVGSPGNLGAQPGAVYEFRFDGLDWTEQGVMAPATPGTYTDFGKSVALQAGRAVVGARVSDGSSIPPSNAYLFRETSTGWQEEARLLASDSGGWSFGYGLSMAGDRLVVSEHADSAPTSGSGSMYLFELAPAVPLATAPALLAGLLSLLGAATLWRRFR